jgi:hypothetical protein
MGFICTIHARSEDSDAVQTGKQSQQVTCRGNCGSFLLERPYPNTYFPLPEFCFLNGFANFPVRIK